MNFILSIAPAQAALKRSTERTAVAIFPFPLSIDTAACFDRAQGDIEIALSLAPSQGTGLVT